MSYSLTGTNKQERTLEKPGVAPAASTPGTGPALSRAAVGRRDRRSALRSVPLFGGLDDDALEQLAEHCRWQTFPAKTVLFSESDTGRTLYILVRGNVVLEKQSGEGAMFVAERRPGDYFGEMALFDNRPRSASAIAKTDCELLLLSQPDFLECVRRYPGMALKIIATLADRLREADDRSAKRTGLSVEGRLAAHLLEMADRAALKTADGRRALPRPSDREIGERIGATRESVNRRLADLDKRGIVIRGERRITLLDEPRLKAITSGAGEGGK